MVRRLFHLSLVFIPFLGYCDQAVPSGGGKGTNTNTRWTEQGAQAVYDGSVEVTGAETVGKYLELIAKSTVTLPALNHARVYLSTATQNVCAIFSNNTTTCFGAAAITGVTAGYGLTGGGTTGNVTLNLASNATAYIQNSSFTVQGSSASISSMTVTALQVLKTLNLTSNKITSVSNGTVSSDAATYGQLHIRSTPQVAFGATETATNSATYVAAGPSLTITPVDSSSQFIICTAGGFGNDNEAATNGYLTIKRGSTDLAQNAGGFYSTGSGVGTVALFGQVGICILDSPATGSAVTYQVYIKHVGGAGNTRYPAFNAGAGNETASIMIVEVI